MGLTLIDLGSQALAGSLTNTEVSASAAIAYSKLAALTDGNFLVGNGSNVATSVSPSGDIDFTNAGVFSIASGAIVNDDVNASAAIAFSKLATLTSANILVGNGSNVAAAVAMSGDVTIDNTGATTIGAGAVDNDMLAGSIADAKLALDYVEVGGDAMTGELAMGSNKITGLGTPTASTDAATKAYADSVASGLDVKDSCDLASTADVAGTYTNTGGASGRGQFTAMSNANIDGVTLAAGQRVLLKDQTGSGAENGIWVITTLGTGSDGVWDRASDFDADAEVTSGAFTFVTNGTVNGSKGYVLTTADPIVIGGASGTALTFSQFSSAAADATTLDGLDSLQFLRSDTNDNVPTGVTLNMDSGSTLSIDGNWDISGTQVTSTATELNVLDGIAAGLTAAELSILDGVTATTGELNILDGVTATFSELNILASCTATTTELNNLGTIVLGEDPGETPDGSTVDDFTVANTPIAGSVQVFLNGVLQEEGAGNDYTISGATITFLFFPASGAKIRVNYRY